MQSFECRLHYWAEVMKHELMQNSSLIYRQSGCNVPSDPMFSDTWVWAIRLLSSIDANEIAYSDDPDQTAPLEF